MNLFEIFGILFVVIGAVQSLAVAGWLVAARKRRGFAGLLFLFMGILFILTGVWMMRLG